MIDKNNLNRIKGILSAKKGAEIPKFQNSGIIKKLNKTNGHIIYSNDDGQTWFSDENCTEEFSGSFEEYGEVTTADDNAIKVEITKPIETNTTVDGKVESETEKSTEQTDPASLNEESSSDEFDSETSTQTKQLAKAAKKEKWKNFGMQAAGTAVAAFEGIGDVIGAKQMATNSATTNMADSLYDTTVSAVEKMGPWGKVAGAAMKYAGIAGDMIQELGRATGERMDTDQMTTTDKWMDSSFFSWNIGLINGAFGKNTQDFGIDQSTLSQVGSSYGGAVSDFNEANELANKRYGLFSKKKRREADNKIATAKSQQNAMANITDTVTDQRNYAQSMGEQAGLAYSMMSDGGYNQKYTYAAKQGGLLEWNPTLEIEWEPQIEINWELPAFKEGGNIDIIEELEWVPEFKDGNKIRTIEELIEYAKKKNPRFIQRLSEESRGIKFIDDEGNDVEGSHYLESRGEYVIPRIQEIDGELKFLSPQEAIDRAMESGNYLEMSPEEAIIFAEQYKQGWPEFFKKFKNGGKTEDSDIPEIEETSQKNVIPEGALHKNKHHMQHAEGLTKKGIPVIDDNGEQQAEIEHSEIIFTLEVTKKLEEYYKIFYSEESSNKEKEQAALDAGKLLVYQILENTEDRTGLIESCKKGGTLTIKESEVVEDLLDWMPTIMIVEEIKEEVEEEKPKKKSELEKDDLKEQVKDVIREALIELLIK